MKTTTIWAAVCALLSGAALARAQTTPPAASNTVQPPRVELAVPFGTVPGRLVTSGQYLIFVDEQNLANSFVIDRQNLADVRNENGTLAFQLKRPVLAEGGDRSQLNLRLVEGGSPDALIAWSKNAAAGASADEKFQSGQAQTQAGVEVYPVKHDHRIGSCNGRLLIYPDKVVFESLTDSADSRQWPLRDIKDMGEKSPYRLHVGSFNGDDYNFELLGKPMDANVYRALADRIAKARASQ